MKKAPIPKNETSRLSALRRMKILDTKPEERFDRITRLATLIFNVPISSIGLIDGNREWFKSVCGLNRSEGDRSISFCGHALLSNGIFIIPDAKKDSRFKDNPMVINPPYIRFYAGVPIFSADGYRVGTFCIKDHKPRKLEKHEQEILKALAAWVEVELNMHNLYIALKATKTLEKQKQLLIKKKIEKEQLDKQYKFISNISHQLRGPISSSLTLLEIIKEQYKLKSIKQAYNKMRSLNDLIATFLFYIEHRENIGKFHDNNVGTINLANIVKNQLALHAEEIKNKKITVTKKMPAQIKISANKVILNRIIYCMLENAVMYNKEHGEIEIRAEKNDKIIKLAISDSGYGIPKKDQKKIFTQYFRAGNASLGSDTGSGLSLYMASLMMKSFGGEITFESEEDKGSTFYLEFPAAR